MTIAEKHDLELLFQTGQITFAEYHNALYAFFPDKNFWQLRKGNHYDD